MSVSHGFKSVGVVGMGQMGMGISYVAAIKAKIPHVVMVDASASQAQKGVAFFESLLKKDVGKGKLEQNAADLARSRLTVVQSIEELGKLDDAKRPGLIVEAATESLPIKLKIFNSLATHLPLDTVLATNTSSISVSKIAAAAVPQGAEKGSTEAWKGPSRALGLHFFNPVPVMSLVELIPALQTDPDVTARARSFAEACGKVVTTSADVPGFVSNRLLMPFINEAIIALESGVASKEDIDTTLKLGMNHPMGPLTLADFIGLDTCLGIMETLYRETADSKYRPAVLLGRMVDAGWMGKKSGKGFYEYAAR
ncbi:putative 3-hydroxybutyryl-CoA dehydrogenase [Ceraceosorus guamensis]|uniref:Putative 3-hydroxybutyryl-CoA dehydrogenase n=1 Tax=Ceraceosorus guamensis TaxID=1522189 RepID=A0A316VNI1_9BASI|nr:putative 3-hydroxybutyryl-CoA dehydrogenase [Ceraceosorus guamensis]PWN39127.1 putative 3-hydroxybutyryl-CoA dehydrogenase [Ceraceosorus guamensis]